MNYEKKIVEYEREILKLKAQNYDYAQALYLISAPARPDGTFNRCREACQIIAENALNGKQQERQ